MVEAREGCVTMGRIEEWQSACIAGGAADLVTAGRISRLYFVPSVVVHAPPVPRTRNGKPAVCRCGKPAAVRRGSHTYRCAKHATASSYYLAGEGHPFDHKHRCRCVDCVRLDLTIEVRQYKSWNHYNNGYYVERIKEAEADLAKFESMVLDGSYRDDIDWRTQRRISP